MRLRRTSTPLPWILLLVAAIVLWAPTARAFHFPWDQGHDIFQPDHGDDDNDPGTDDGCNSCPCTSKSMSPVEEASGNFAYTLNVVKLLGLGPHVEIELTYNSQDLRRGPFGVGWTFPFDQRLVETTDGVEVHVVCSKPNGKRERFLRNPDGSFTPPPYLHSVLVAKADGSYELTDRFGWRQLYDSSGQLTSIVDRNDNAVVLVHDATGFLTSVSDAGGRTVRFVKGPNGLVAAVLDPADRSFGFSYDGNGNLVAFTDPLGDSTHYEYDSKHNLTRIVDPLGYPQQQLTYDSEGRVSVHKELAETYTYGYDPAASRTTKRDSAGHVWTYTYNDNGNITKIVGPLGNVVEYVLDDSLNVLRRRDANGNEYQYTYDAFGNPTSNTDPLGGTRRFAFESQFSQPVSVTDKRGNSTTFELDDHGNPIRIADPVGTLAELTYDAAGQLIRVTNGEGGSTQVAHDEHGNVVSITDPLGNTTTRTFDILGNVTSETDPAGHTTLFRYDDAERLIEVEGAAGGITRYGYDAAGRLVSSTTASGRTTNYEYDAYGRLERSIDPLGRVTVYAYDVKGNVTAVLDANGVTTTYQYDAENRLLHKVSPDGPVDFTYDAAGRLLSVEDTDSRVTFAYDALDRIVRTETSATSAQPASVVTYTYDADSNRASMVGPDGGITHYTYDPRARLVQIEDPASNLYTFSHDAMARRVSVDRSPIGITTTYSYDAASRLTGLAHGSTPAIAFDYAYDAAGNRTSISGPAGTFGYEYDDLKRLVRVTAGLDVVEQYTYDAVGNVLQSHLTATATYDAGNELLSDSRFDYTYDQKGNLLTKTERQSGATTAYSYDSMGQLVRIDLPDGTVASYAYDGLGRRISKSAHGTTTQYVYDGLDILAEYEDGAQVATYTHGPRLDEVLAVRRGGSTFHLLTDASLSVVEVVDGSGVVASYDYDSFGRLLAETGSRVAPFGFQGREYDGESGLYFYRARYYDPASGRFLTPDPLRFRGVDNVYRFEDDNPVNRLDPLGRQAGALAPAIGTGLGFAAADGPLPIGDIIGAIIIGGAVIAVLAEALNDDGEAGDAADEGGETCPVPPPIPANPDEAPGEGWEWRGKGPPGSKEGSWYNPETGESLHPDLGHPPPVGPHWDWKDPSGQTWRIPPGGGAPIPK